MSRLLDRLSVLTASCTAPSTDDADIRAALERDAKRQVPLARWNAEYSRRVTAGIQAAADVFLNEHFRNVTHPSGWTGALRNYLERRHEDFGLEHQPSRRKVKDALRTWATQKDLARLYGCSSTSA